MKLIKDTVKGSTTCRILLYINIFVALYTIQGICAARTRRKCPSDGLVIFHGCSCRIRIVARSVDCNDSYKTQRIYDGNTQLDPFSPSNPACNLVIVGYHDNKRIPIIAIITCISDS